MERICADPLTTLCLRSDQFPAVSTTFRLIGHRHHSLANPLTNILGDSPEISIIPDFHTLSLSLSGVIVHSVSYI